LIILIGWINLKKHTGSTIAILLGFVAVGSLVFLNTAVTGNIVAAQEGKLNENDFKIKDFGFKDGKPWLTVEGKAGASTPENASQIYAYAFVTDKGIFAVASHGFEDSPQVANDTKWHTHKVTLDSTEKCVSKLSDDGNAEVNGEIDVANITATKVDKVMTAVLGINNADASVCVEKVFDSKNSTK
jgi:hypothetical protein